MATLRESTSLLMAAAENGHYVSDHSWAVSAPAAHRSRDEQEKKKRKMLMGLLAALLTISIAAVIFFFFLPSDTSHHARRQTMEVSNLFPKWTRKLGVAGTEHIVDSSDPSVKLNVTLTNITATEGLQVPTGWISSVPSVVISGQEEDLHTLVMVDLNMSRSWWPWATKEYIHWLVVNIPGNSHISEGQTMIEYEPPLHFEGGHTYLMALFKQPCSSGVGEVADRIRYKFETKAFAERHMLGLPLAAVQCQFQEESVKLVSPPLRTLEAM